MSTRTTRSSIKRAVATIIVAATVTIPLVATSGCGWQCPPGTHRAGAWYAQRCAK